MMSDLDIGNHSEIQGMAIRPPPFYYSNVPVRLQQLESQFILANNYSRNHKIPSHMVVFSVHIDVRMPEKITDGKSYRAMKDFMICSRKRSHTEAIETHIMETIR